MTVTYTFEARIYDCVCGASYKCIVSSPPGPPHGKVTCSRCGVQFRPTPENTRAA